MLYYNKNDPNDQRELLNDGSGFYIGFFTVIGLLSLTFLIWIISEAFYFWKDQREPKTTPPLPPENPASGN